MISKDVELRQFQEDDVTELARLANDKTIFDNVRDYFPNPYTIKDAQSFILQTSLENPACTFAIIYRKQLAGVVGIKRQTDIYRKSGEVGYWIGAPYRGKGIATIAVAIITTYGIKKLGLNRLYAGVFSTNPASMKVLEKCGYLREGISRNGVWKSGRFLDEYRYGFVEDQGMKAPRH